MLSSLKKALALAALPFSLQAQAYQIEPLGEGFYRFIDDRHRSVFMITDQGALVTDPMNHAAASWLNNEIKERFDTPVRYVVYSHNHSDHIYGGEVFDTPGDHLHRAPAGSSGYRQDQGADRTAGSGLR